MMNTVRKKQLTVWILLFCMVVSMLPVAASPPEETEAAADVTIGSENWEYMGSNGEHTFFKASNGDFKVRGTYYTSSTACLSYHTNVLYFTKEYTGANPTTKKYRSVDVFDPPKHTSVPDPNDPSQVIDTYTVPKATIADIITYLYTEEERKGLQEVQLYISEGFCLKRRQKATDAWNYDRSKTYKSLSEIQGAAPWSQQTKNNFPRYYDTCITFNLDDYGLGEPDKHTLSVTVNDEDAGVAYGTDPTNQFAKGAKAKIKAVPNDGYTFKEWEVVSGSPTIANKTKADTTLTMPDSDVTVRAVFAKENVPKPTKKPINTPKPGEPTLTPTPTPTPKPTPTLGPTPTPPLPDPQETYKQDIWYYTTDQGYTIKGIYDKNGPLASQHSQSGSGRTQSSKYTALDRYYSTGWDASGNTWYFIPDGTNATYVHPKVYQGIAVDSAQVKNIIELVFPETITYNGTAYTVTSIGGGTDKYHSPEWKDISNIANSEYGHYSLNTISGEYSYNQSHSFSDGYSWTMINSVHYHYGVIGNGEITSYGSFHRDWNRSDGYSYDYEDYESSYYVYNTTLEYITIPATVTEICDYAFFHCQGLRKITGAEGVKEIGKYAFAGASVLKTTLSEKDSDGNYRYYHYNESYSTGAPTAVMLAWESAVPLREYMQLAEFPVLDRIEERAFAYRKNLFDVKLPACVTQIGEDAFYTSDLNTIEIPGKATVIYDSQNTLGTKGNPDTLIITVPESKAMFYGIKYENYYTLRCGYPITYDKNAEPPEQYTTASMLQMIKKEVKTSFTSGYYTITLDTEGTLWSKHSSSLFPSKVASGKKFTSLQKFSLSERSSSSSSSYSYNSCFAFAEDGMVYYYDTKNYSWKDTGIPAGSSGHQVVYSTVTDSSSQSNGDGSSWGGSSSIKIYYLYYLDGNGIPSRKEIYRSTQDRSGSSSGDTYYSSSYSFSTGSTIETLPVPEEVTFRSLYVVDVETNTTSSSASYGDGYSSETKSYSLHLPDVYAEDTEGRMWHASGGKGGEKKYDSYSGKTETSSEYSESERTNRAIPASYYTWETKDGIRQVLLEFEGGTYYSGSYYSQTAKHLHILDAAGNLLLYQNIEKKQSSWETPNLLGSGKAYTILSGQNIVSAEVVSMNYVLLTGADGSRWVYHYRNPEISYTPVKLPDDVRVAALWEVSNSHSGKSGSWDENYSYYHDFLLLLDDTGRLWTMGKTSRSYYDTYYGRNETSWTSSALTCRLTGVEQVGFRRDNLSGGMSIVYSNPAYILDKNGDMWQFTVGRIYEDGKDIYLHYYYPDGRLEKITEKEKLTAAQTALSLSTTKTTISVGYEFAEVLYANMFDHPGYRLLAWNTKADGSGSSYQPGEKVRLTAPLTLYAQWDRMKNSIRYAPNGGSGIMEDDAYEPDVTTAVLKKNSFVRACHEFTGWNTKADGSGIAYADGAAITMSAGTTVLYAQWKPFPYVVKIAEDEVRVQPPKVTDTKRLNYGEEMTIPAALPDKVYTVTYNLNPQGTTPYWKTEYPLPDRYTKATLSFLGWQLYEETKDGYHYLGLYQPGAVVKNLAKTKDAVLYLFPYWGGEASYVDLPLAGSKGYDFIGWTIGKGYAPYKVPEGTEILYAPEGSCAQYKPKGNETLYAYWEPATLFTILNDRGATSTDHTLGVLVTYGEPVPDIIVPEKEGFTFQGYYTEVRGKGTEYYDENGKLLLEKEKMWDDAPKELYACWKQNPVEYPETSPSPAVTEEPAKAPEDIVIEKTPYAKITSSDYDVTKAVPSTETVELTLYAGKYAFSGVISNVTGVKDITIHVKIPYTMRYEDEETEELIDSEVRYAEYDIIVPRAYSYWKIDRADIRKPFSGKVTSEVFAGTPELSFSIADNDFYTVKTYTDAEHAADPNVSLTGEEVHIWGMENGKNISEDRITEIVSAYAKNLAYTDTTPLIVKSDLLVFAGKTILPDTAGRSGAAHDSAGCETAAAAIPWVQSSVAAAFNEKAGNGVYENTKDTDRPIETELTELLYSPLSGRTGTATATGFPVNQVTIHTPVAANPEGTLYQAPRENASLTHSIEDEEDKDTITIDDYTEFLHMDLSRLMTGTHINEKGYGTRDYRTTLSGRTPFDCIVVKAGVPLYFDISGDTKTDAAGKPVDTEDDVRFEKDSIIRFVFEDGAWYLAEEKTSPRRTEKHPVDIADMKVYVLATECTSDFDVSYGVLAVNGKANIKDFNGTNYNGLFVKNAWHQEYANTNPKYYFACRTVGYTVHYKYITFRFYDTQEKGTNVKLSEEGYSSVAQKRGYEAYFYATLPEGFQGSMEIKPKYSLVDTKGDLVDDDILVLFPDYIRFPDPNDPQKWVYLRCYGMMPQNEYSLEEFQEDVGKNGLTLDKIQRNTVNGATRRQPLQEFRSNWLKYDKISGTGISQYWTFDWVRYDRKLLNDAGVAERIVNGAEMQAWHGAYRLPSSVRVLRKCDIPDLSDAIGLQKIYGPVTKDDFSQPENWRLRDSVIQSDLFPTFDTAEPFAVSGYLWVELDIKVINADGTVMVEHGTLPTISLYYTIGDTTEEGLYYQHNGKVPEGTRMGDDVEVDYVHVR